MRCYYSLGGALGQSLLFAAALTLLALSAGCQRDEADYRQQTTIQKHEPGPAIRGTPIDSPPATNVAAPPAGSLPKAGPSGLPATNLPAHSVTAAVQANKDYLEAGFNKLSSFPAEVIYEEVRTNSITVAHPTKLKGPIPDAIRTFDNRRVAVKGFMLPLSLENGLTSDFILLRGPPKCCFGAHLSVNEWIHVKMSTRGVKCIWITPLTVLGTLHVGE